MLVVALIGYSTTTLPGVRSSSGYVALIDGWLQNSILVAASLLICARAYVDRTCRVGWLGVGLGLGLYAAGNIIYFARIQFLDPMPYPSGADVPWLLSYPFLFVGFVALIRRRIPATDRTLVLDGVIAAIGVSAVAATWLELVLHSTHGAKSAVAVVTLAYPIGDLALLMLVVATSVVLGWRTDRAWVYLGVGLAMFAAADTIYALRSATGTYVAGTPLDPMWAVAAVLIAAAALRRTSPQPERRRRGWIVHAVPALFTMSSLTLLTYGGLRRIAMASVFLAAATVLLVLVRAVLSSRDVQRLAISATLARTDELTGLGNRRRFQEDLDARIRSLGPAGRLAVLLLDLDGFKEVNDSLGHSVGDQLLIAVGRRLQTHMRSDDLLVRLGGDEFVIMLPQALGEEAERVANRLRADLQSEFTVDGVTMYIDVSIGIAICPDVATTVGGLLQRADIAMYEAKAERLGCLVYRAAGADDLSDRLRLIQDLRSAIDHGQLVLHYQPKLDLRTGHLDGLEALVRWHHPVRGLLAPDAFLPQAERYGFMRRLTTVVLAMALEQLSRWHAEGIPTSVAVNLSTSSLMDTGLPRQVADLLALRSLPAEALIIEVTETTLMHDPARALSTLTELRNLGVRVSVDDYGTGYSSLARLRDLPVNELKIDKSFISAMDNDDRAVAIVASTIQLAHSLDLTVVAEGVETAIGARMLGELHCDVGQGYYFARPLPPAELAVFLRTTAPDASDTVGRGFLPPVTIPA